MKNFKPQLAPNQEVDLNEINYPMFASYKLDGARIVFYKGQILTRSLKQLPNKQLRQKLEPIRQYSENYNLILDGEIYSHDSTFQEIISFFMTQDFESKKSIKKYGKILTIPDNLKFYCFDCVKNDNFELEFIKRCMNIVPIAKIFEKLMFFVYQFKVNSKEDINKYFNEAIENGYEGLILRNPMGRYKFGRGTIKEGLIFKVKPFKTFDAQITEVVQATKVDPNAEKKTNELGRSVTSKKKNDRILIEKACDFVVKYEGLNLKVVIALTDIEKREIWKNKDKYIGKWIEYKGMLVGSKDVPRHPTFIRFRKDKD